RNLVEHARIAFAMPHELPLQVHSSLDNVRMLTAEIRIKRNRPPDAELRHSFRHPEYAHTISIVALRPRGDVRNLGRFAGYSLVQREELDIGHEPNGYPSAIRPFERRSVGEGGIGKGSVVLRVHRDNPCLA